MAVAILDRTLESLENAEETREKQLKNTYSARNLSDEQHNAKIGEIYARLINPSAKIDDILERNTAEPKQAVKEIFADKPYLVENARADAEIFRADSPVNRRAMDILPVTAYEAEGEEENEDLRPTRTTIQYKTSGVTKTPEEGKIQNTDAEKRAGLSKKEKIVIGVVVGVIVALFALIIINSAILSGINSELSSLQSSLTMVKASYAGVSDEVNTMLANALKDVEQFAILKGLIK
ncbi:MAG: hypothetical protein K2L42_04870 [Clostridia bacterium]|nr:hypothetical protein [Clostridia bacterium]